MDCKRLSNNLPDVAIRHQFPQYPWYQVSESIPAKKASSLEFAFEFEDVEFLDFGDCRKSLSMLSELVKLESTASSEFC